jgi:hypothetical protein
MFDRIQLMERKSFALATDTVAKGVVQESARGRGMDQTQ